MSTRRSFLLATGSAAILVGCHKSDDKSDEGGEDVTPVEDLMREHGVLRRVMYLYDEAALRLDNHGDAPLDSVAACAGLVRHVIEDYHEKLEEEMVFPRFETAGKMSELTAALRRQHVTGRSLTDQIVALAKGPLGDSDRATLAATMRRFNHMYRAHAAREDTVLFPAFRGLVGAKAYGELGEQFEDKEKQMLGDHGFEHAVADVNKLERAFGVSDLAAIT